MDPGDPAAVLTAEDEYVPACQDGAAVGNELLPLAQQQDHQTVRGKGELSQGLSYPRVAGGEGRAEKLNGDLIRVICEGLHDVGAAVCHFQLLGHHGNQASLEQNGKENDEEDDVIQVQTNLCRVCDDQNGEDDGGSASHPGPGDQKDLPDTFAGGKAQTIGDYNNAFMQLESGAVDAVACDLSIADYQMAAKPDMFVKLEPLSTENYAVGFAKDGDAAMVDAVNKPLKEMYDDGTIAKLCEKWGEYGISIDNWVLVD